jgi:hypothetical protein
MERFKLLRVALNPCSHTIDRYVIKLSYAFASSDRPKIEVFEKSNESQEKCWEIYGAPDENILCTYTFSHEGDSIEIPTYVNAPSLKITYLGHEKETYIYPKSKEEVSAYMFEVSR